MKTNRNSSVTLAVVAAGLLATIGLGTLIKPFVGSQEEAEKLAEKRAATEKQPDGATLNTNRKPATGDELANAAKSAAGDASMAESSDNINDSKLKKGLVASMPLIMNPYKPTDKVAPNPAAINNQWFTDEFGLDKKKNATR